MSQQAIDNLGASIRAKLAPQEDAAIVAAMARQALEDVEVLGVLADAGCKFPDEARAFLNSEVN